MLAINCWGKLLSDNQMLKPGDRQMERPSSETDHYAAHRHTPADTPPTHTHPKPVSYFCGPHVDSVQSDTGCFRAGSISSHCLPTRQTIPDPTAICLPSKYTTERKSHTQS
ncbi:unnamed protein product [Gadus morhua 'NCC']